MEDIDVDLDYLAEVAFVRILHCKITFHFPAFYTVLFGGKKGTVGNPQLKGRELGSNSLVVVGERCGYINHLEFCTYAKHFNSNVSFNPHHNSIIILILTCDKM